MSTWTWHVDLAAPPKGNHRINRRTGHLYDPLQGDIDTWEHLCKLRAYSAGVRVPATAPISKRHGERRVAGPIRVNVSFQVGTAPADGGAYPTKRGQGGDLDKLERTALDALARFLIVDDAQVVALNGAKVWGEEGVWLTVQEIAV